jgi:hypothetical protein
MIIGTVGFQLPPKVPFVHDDNVIEALSAYGPDQSLHIRILPRRARRRKHLLYAEAFHSIAESSTVDTVPVAYQVAWNVVEWESLHHLLSSPFRSRMIRRVEVNNFSSIVTQNDKHV